MVIQLLLVPIQIQNVKFTLLLFLRNTDQYLDLMNIHRTIKVSFISTTNYCNPIIYKQKNIRIFWSKMKFLASNLYTISFKNKTMYTSRVSRNMYAKFMVPIIQLHNKWYRRIASTNKPCTIAFILCKKTEEDN